MYQPKHFTAPQADALGIAEQIALAALICSQDGDLIVNHIPFFVERDKGCLVGHLARANPDLKSYDSAQNVCAVFTGPQVYISPNYYLSEQVPTWNYSVVHVHGRARVIDDSQFVKAVVERLSALHEQRFTSPWKLNKLPDAKVDALLRAIVGIEIYIERVELKHKLSQNRDTSDRASLQQHLHNSPQKSDQLMADWMASQIDSVR